MSRAQPLPARTAAATPGAQPLAGRFRLDERLHDATARPAVEAWRAWDEWLGRRVLVRLLAPEFARHPRVSAVLRAQARTSARTRHPNLVERLQVTLGPGRPHVVTELVEGEWLDTRLARGGTLDVREVAAIVTGVAAGLTALHGAGMAHGDVTPWSILLGADGRTRLGDPDPVRVAGVPTAAGLDGARLDPAWRFMAPEVRAGGPPTPAADAYALAAVAYAALAGRPPIVTAVAPAAGRPLDPPIRPSLLRAGLDPAVDRLLLAALGPAGTRPAPYPLAVGLVAALRASEAGGIAAGGGTRGPAGLDGSGRTRRMGRARGALVSLVAGGIVLATAAVGLAALDGAIASVRGRPAPAVDGLPVADLAEITGPVPAPQPVRDATIADSGVERAAARTETAPARKRAQNRPARAVSVSRRTVTGTPAGRTGAARAGTGSGKVRAASADRRETADDDHADDREKDHAASD